MDTTTLIQEREEISGAPEASLPNASGTLTMKEFNRILTPFMKPAWRPAIAQMLNTILPYILIVAAMFYSLRFGYWLTLILAIPAAGFLVRIFILFHDCGHNSFTPSAKANKWIGLFLGMISLTPGEQWWKSHAIHHATSGNIDRRGIGDVDTWTVAEFQAKSWLERVGYSLFRFPLIMFGLGPLWMFIISHRFTLPRYGRKETMSVVWTNLGIAIWVSALSFLTGSFLNVVMVFLPIFWIGGLLGIWMFYVQHQFEDVYWAHEEDWNYVLSAIKGASFYDLPKVIQWFTGNIGYHHIHHLSPRVPNYRLEAAHRSNPIFQREVKRIGFSEAFRTVRLRLIDESKNNRLVTFQDILG
jgi:omega-6 fatty acid desaturase (delta-12 desaturase)